MNASDGSARPIIVVGTDGSPSAREAVGYAARLARMLGGTVHLVTAYQPVIGSGMVLQPAASPRATAEEILIEAADRVREAGIEVEAHAVPDAAADAIVGVAKAQRAQMILVGNKGMGSARRFLLGSVPNRISHHAPCNVLIVRTGERAGDEE